MECVVLRSFAGPGGYEFLPGEIVDASKFRLVDKLIAQRRLRLATAEELAASVEIDNPDARVPTRPSRPSRSEASTPSLKAKKRNR